jgi:glycosyltransferase involved in cell wall biosynthesis
MLAATDLRCRRIPPISSREVRGGSTEEPAPDVSILTALYRPERSYLFESYEAILGQEGATWEWVLQVDGDEGDLERWVPVELCADERVRPAATGRHCGVSPTRNVGLARSRAELVQSLDQDDLLAPSAIAAGVATLRGDPELAFCFGEGLHLTPEGTLEARPAQKRVLEPGRIEPGEIEARWNRGRRPHGMVLPGAMWRRQYLFAYGGWASLPALEDYGICFPVAQRHPIAFIDQVTFHRRDHPGQESRTPDRSTMAEVSRPFVLARLDAMREIMGDS